MSTSLAGISPAKFTDKSRQLFVSSRENMGKITNGFSYSTNNCSPQVIPVHQQDFMVYQACGTSTYNLAKYLTKILKVYVGHSSSFVKDSKDLTDKLQSIKLQDNEELVSFDVSALFTSIPVNQVLDVINQLIIQHQTNMDFKYKVGKAWYEVADHLDREDVMTLLKIVLNNCLFFLSGKVLQTITWCCNGFSMFTSSG